mgnify:FL=1
MIKVVIADDHTLVINGIQKVLATTDLFTILDTFKNGEDLLNGLKTLQPDILLLDIQMPGKTGIELAGIINKKYPNIKIIALTNIEIIHQVKKMISNGAQGYLLKDVEPQLLIKTITDVYNGEQVIHPRIKDELTKSYFSKSNANPELTRREIEILKLIADEFTNPEIAEKLFISPHTVENHRNHILQKLGVKNTAGLIKKAIEEGII